MKENISSEREVVTARQAAELLPGMTYARLMRLAKLGEIPSIQYGTGARRFLLISDLAEYARASGFDLDGDPFEVLPDEDGLAALGAPFGGD